MKPHRAHRVRRTGETTGGMVLAIILITIGVAGLVAQTTGWSRYWWTFIILGGGLVIVLTGIFNYFWMKARMKR